MRLVAKANKSLIKTTDSNHNQYVAPNLLKQDFNATKPSEKFVTDITYMPTDEGWLYLSVIIDLYSRMVIGWSMANHMRAELVCDTLEMAMFRRGMPTGVIVHSDKGSRYCSKDFQDKIKKYQLKSSMSGKGCCYDNAACESFFGTLKVELCDDENYKTIESSSFI
jgi:transposase InsO family protein